MRIAAIVAAKRLIVIVFLFVAIVANAVDLDKSSPPDIRVLVDISGSMKKNDPNNLRQPATELLIELFPEHSKAGVWTFGQWVNMLIPHKKVDETWRSRAQPKVDEITSVGLFTNIADALKKGLYDIDSLPSDHNTSVILLTDGMVDIDKDPEVNAKVRTEILEVFLPKARDKGVTIHTIALSDNADWQLLKRLASETQGLAEVVDNADDLAAIFARAFSAASPQQELPLDENSFLVDSQIEEFTALIFRAADSKTTLLVSPAEEEYSSRSEDSDLQWLARQNFDLITVTRPYEGEWFIKTTLAPDSKIMVVSNLELLVNQLPSSFVLGESQDLAVALLQAGDVITEQNFLALAEVNLRIERDSDGQSWDYLLSDTLLPEDGVFRKTISVFDTPGTYTVAVNVDGKTFARSRVQQLQVLDTFELSASRNSAGGRVYTATLFAQNSDIDSDTTEVTAILVSPEGKREKQFVSLHAERSWQVMMDVPNNPGIYQLEFQINAAYFSGDSIISSVETIAINHDIGDTALLNISSDSEETVDTAIDSVEKPTVDEAQKVVKPVADTEQESSSKRWVIYAAIAAGNLLLVVIGFFAYKLLIAGNKSAVLDDADIEEMDIEEVDIDSSLEDGVGESAAPVEQIDNVETDALAHDEALNEDHVEELASALEDDVSEDDVAGDDNTSADQDEIPVDDDLENEDMEFDDSLLEGVDNDRDEDLDSANEAGQGTELDELERSIQESPKDFDLPEDEIDISLDLDDEDKPS